MHIVFDQQGKRSKFRDPCHISYFRDPRHCKSASSSQLPADVHRRLSAGCSIFSYYGFHKKYFHHPAITMEPGRRRHSCVPAANRSYRRSSTRSDASRINDHDMHIARVDEFVGGAMSELYCDMDILLIPGLRSTLTMWHRRFKDKFKNGDYV